MGNPYNYDRQAADEKRTFADLVPRLEDLKAELAKTEERLAAIQTEVNAVPKPADPDYRADITKAQREVSSALKKARYDIKDTFDGLGMLITRAGHIRDGV